MPRRAPRAAVRDAQAAPRAARRGDGHQDQKGARGGVVVHPRRRPAAGARPGRRRVRRRRQPRAPGDRLLGLALAARGARRRRRRRGRAARPRVRRARGGGRRVGRAVAGRAPAAGGVPPVRHGAADAARPRRDQRLLQDVLRAAGLLLARLPRLVALERAARRLRAADVCARAGRHQGQARVAPRD